MSADKQTLVRILAAVYTVFWIGGIASHALPSSVPAPAWASPLFLLLAASLTTLTASERRPLLVFAAGGFIAELIGVHTGLPFGRYTYTEVLGPRLGDVPMAIPLMWFALALIGYVMASLMLWRQPVHANPGFRSGLLTAWLAAMVITAFDLGADPYFVFVLKAWIMQKTDGGWFGETLQGFAGWMAVSRC